MMLPGERLAIPDEHAVSEPARCVLLSNDRLACVPAKVELLVPSLGGVERHTGNSLAEGEGVVVRTDRDAVLKRDVFAQPDLMLEAGRQLGNCAAWGT